MTDKEVRSELDNVIISESEVLKLLKELDASKAMNPDNINTFLIKGMAEVFVNYLHWFFLRICIFWYCPNRVEGGKGHPDIQKRK